MTYKMQYLGFFGSIILVFATVSTYLFIRGWQAIPNQTNLRIAYSVLFALLTITPWLARTVHVSATPLLLHFGYTWVIAAVYLALTALFFDLVRFANTLIPFYPEWVKTNYTIVKPALLGGSLFLVCLLLVYGNWRYRNPVTTTYQINLSSALSRNIHMVAVSDLHLGENIGAGPLQKWVNHINSLKPDIIVMAGDITDRGADENMIETLAPVLRQLQAPMGVFAIPGNHDRYGRQRVSMDDFMNASGIRYLRDETVLVDSLFYLVGREDNRNRKNMEVLLEAVNRTKPIFLLDHRPDRMDEAIAHRLDLQISGHTHKGQFFPVTLIVKNMYELAYGHLQRENTHIIVSSGLGLWGPPYRIGTVSEVVSVRILSEAAGASAGQ